MILRRIGNKKKIANKIQSYFPPHKLYIEPFFGAGGMFFNKPKVKYNILNDLDSDVFNLYRVITNQKDEFLKSFYMMPIHSDLFNFWLKNKEIEPIKNALRFLLLSNFSFLGRMDTMRNFNKNSKKIILENIEKTYKLIYDVDFLNYDFRKFIKMNFFINKNSKPFIYCDPPYLNTTNNYSNLFTENDVIDLFDMLEESEYKFAYSEFDNKFVISEAKKRNLNVITIGERRNINNIRIEILITNFNQQLTLF